MEGIQIDFILLYFKDTNDARNVKTITYVSSIEVLAVSGGGESCLRFDRRPCTCLLEHRRLARSLSSLHLSFIALLSMSSWDEIIEILSKNAHEMQDRFTEIIHDNEVRVIV